MPQNSSFLNLLHTWLRDEPALVGQERHFKSVQHIAGMSDQEIRENWDDTSHQKSLFNLRETANAYIQDRENRIKENPEYGVLRHNHSMLDQRLQESSSSFYHPEKMYDPHEVSRMNSAIDSMFNKPTTTGHNLPTSGYGSFSKFEDPTKQSVSWQSGWQEDFSRATFNKPESGNKLETRSFNDIVKGVQNTWQNEENLIQSGRLNRHTAMKPLGPRMAGDKPVYRFEMADAHPSGDKRFYDVGFEANSGAFFGGESGSSDVSIFRPSIGVEQDKKPFADPTVGGFRGVGNNLQSVLSGWGTGTNYNKRRDIEEDAARKRQGFQQPRYGGGENVNLHEATLAQLFDFSRSVSIPSTTPQGQPVDPTLAKQLAETTGSVLGGMFARPGRGSSFLADTQAQLSAGPSFTSATPKDWRRYLRGQTQGTGATPGMVDDGVITSRIRGPESPTFASGVQNTSVLYGYSGAFGEGGSKVVGGSYIQKLKDVPFQSAPDALGFQVGDVFATDKRFMPKDLMQGDRFRGSEPIPGLDKFGLGNAMGARVQSISYDPETRQSTVQFATMHDVAWGETKPAPGYKGQNQPVGANDPHMQDAFLLLGRMPTAVSDMPIKPSRLYSIGHEMMKGIQDLPDVLSRLERAAAGKGMSTEDLYSNLTFQDKAGNVTDRENAWGVQYNEQSQDVYRLASLQMVQDNMQTRAITQRLETRKMTSFIQNLGEDAAREKFSNTTLVNAQTGDTKPWNIGDEIPTVGDHYFMTTNMQQVLPVSIIGSMLARNFGDTSKIDANMFNQMRNQQPAVADFVLNQIKSGKVNSGRDIIKSLRANTMGAEGIGTTASAMDAREGMDFVSGSEIPFAKIRQQVEKELGHNVTEDQIQKGVMSKISETYGSRNLKIGDVALPTLKTLDREYKLNDYGSKVKGIGTRAYELLAQESSLFGSGSADASARNSALGDLLSEMNRMTTDAASVDRDTGKLRQSAQAFEIPAFGGAMQAAGGIPFDTAVVNTEDFMSYVRKLDLPKEDRDRMIQNFKSGRGAWGASAMSEAVAGAAWEQTKFVSAEWFRENQLGFENFEVAPGGIARAADWVAAQSKDNDGDLNFYNVATSLEREELEQFFPEMGRHRQVEEIPGKEVQASGKKLKDYRTVIEKLIKSELGARDPELVKGMTPERMSEGYWKKNYAEIGMGNTFDPYVRSLTETARGLTRRFNKGAEQAAVWATSMLGGTNYQTFMDLEPSLSKASNTLMAAGKAMYINDEGKVEYRGKGFRKEETGQRYREHGFDLLGTMNMRMFSDQEENDERYLGTEDATGMIDRHAQILAKVGDITDTNRIEAIRKALTGIYHSGSDAGYDFGETEGSSVAGSGLTEVQRKELLGAITGQNLQGNVEYHAALAQYMGVSNDYKPESMSIASTWLGGMAANATYNRDKKGAGVLAKAEKFGRGFVELLKTGRMFQARADIDRSTLDPEQALFQAQILGQQEGGHYLGMAQTMAIASGGNVVNVDASGQPIPLGESINALIKSSQLTGMASEYANVHPIQAGVLAFARKQDINFGISATARRGGGYSPSSRTIRIPAYNSGKFLDGGGSALTDPDLPEEVRAQHRARLAQAFNLPEDEITEEHDLAYMAAHEAGHAATLKDMTPEEIAAYAAARDDAQTLAEYAAIPEEELAHRAGAALLREMDKAGALGVKTGYGLEGFDLAGASAKLRRARLRESDEAIPLDFEMGDTPGISRMKKAQLTRLAEQRGIDPTGTRENIISRIRAQDQRGTSSEPPPLDYENMFVPEANQPSNQDYEDYLSTLNVQQAQPGKPPAAPRLSPAQQRAADKERIRENAEGEDLPPELKHTFQGRRFEYYTRGMERVETQRRERISYYESQGHDREKSLSMAAGDVAGEEKMLLALMGQGQQQGDQRGGQGGFAPNPPSINDLANLSRNFANLQGMVEGLEGRDPSEAEALKIHKLFKSVNSTYQRGRMVADNPEMAEAAWGDPHKMDKLLGGQGIGAFLRANQENMIKIGGLAGQAEQVQWERKNQLDEGQLGVFQGAASILQSVGEGEIDEIRGTLADPEASKTAKQQAMARGQQIYRAQSTVRKGIQKAERTEGGYDAIGGQEGVAAYETVQGGIQGLGASLEVAKGQGIRAKALAGVDTGATQEAVGQLEGLNEHLADLGGVLKDVNEKQGDYVKQGKAIVKMYDELLPHVERARSDSARGVATPEQEALLSRSGLVNAETGKGIADLRQSVATQDARVKLQPQLEDPEVRQMQLQQLLMRGGRGGDVARAMDTKGLYAEGLDIGIGTIKNRDTIDMIGGGMRAANHMQGMMRGAMMFQHQVMAPMQGAAEFYEQRTNERSQTLASVGGISYDELMSGGYGQRQRRSEGFTRMQEAAGQQIYQSFAGAAGGIASEAGGRTIGGLASIMAPGMGLAMAATQMGNPGAALPLGLLGAGAGAINYFTQSTQDTQGMGSTVRGMVNRTNAFNQGSGLGYQVGVGDNALETMGRDPLGATSLALASIFNREGFTAAVGQGALDQGASDYANGRGGTGSVNEWAANAQRVTGASRGTVMQSMLTGFVNQQSELGISQQDALGIYSFQQTYGANQQLGSGVFGNMSQLAARGVANVPQMAISAAASQGMSQWNQAGVTGQANDISNWMLAQGPEANLTFLGGQVQDTINRNTNVNRARQLAGQSTRSFDFYSAGGEGAAFGGSAISQDLLDQGDVIRANNAQSSPSFDSALGDYGQMVGRAQLGISDFAGANRTNQRMQNFGGMFTGFQTSGGNMGQVQGAMSQALMMGQDQYNQAMAGASGNPYALSSMFAGSGNQQYNLIDIQTGMSNLHYGVDAGERQAIRGFQQQSGRQGWGTGNLQSVNETENLMRNIQVDQQETQYQWAQQSRAIDRNVQMGGATGVNAQGFAQGQVPGGGLAQLAGIFQANGMNFNAGNGMGQWQIQDAQTQLGRAQQDWSMMRGTQNLQLGEQDFARGGRQWDENYAQNRKQFQYSTSYQSNEMIIGRGQEVTRRGWQAEDMAFGQAQAEVNFGWQMEDADRNIKYARGRNRRDLLREKERTVTSFSMAEGQRDRERDRFDQSSKWSDDAFEREKKHFEETKKFQEEEMELSRKHHDEDRRAQRTRMDMAIQDHAREIQWTLERRGLEDQERLLSRQVAQLQMNLTERQAAQVQAWAVQMRGLSENLQLITGYEQQRNASLQLGIAQGRVFTDVINQLVAAMGGATGGGTGNGGLPPNVKPPGDGGGGGGRGAPGDKGGRRYGGSADLSSVHEMLKNTTPPAGYRFGGYTGAGAKNDVVGSTHAGEYVVPQEGSLVVKDGSSVEVLRQVVALLQEQNKMMKQLVDYGPMRQNNIIHTKQSAIQSSGMSNYDEVFTQ